MVEPENICKLSVLGSEQHDSLVLACLKNRWLNLGIKPSGPNATETPDFAFLNADDICALREYFQSGPHRLREGVVYQGLAFVQQVDMGDEWLVLRSCFDENTGERYWVPFESYSMNNVIASPARFECAITALQDDDRFDTAVLLGASSRQRQTRANS